MPNVNVVKHFFFITDAKEKCARSFLVCSNIFGQSQEPTFTGKFQ